MRIFNENHKNKSFMDELDLHSTSIQEGELILISILNLITKGIDNCTLEKNRGDFHILKVIHGWGKHSKV